MNADADADDPKSPTPAPARERDEESSAAPSAQQQGGAGGYLTPSRPAFSQRARGELLGRVHTRGWVSLRDFATVIADVSYQTANVWVKLGMIKIVRIGGIRRVYENEVARFLRDGTLPPDPKTHEALREKRRPYEKAYHQAKQAQLKQRASKYRKRENPK